ncbi:unnamed protein product [Cuscuta epithymum]|uniref:Uncharacterized protein n=1 Tax=Cuscuta epithymum TaxID=186058 RepID=A0AAV0FJ61_9ASTE|nr:unnamed protein product [Cuscuta epithymum]
MESQTNQTRDLRFSNRDSSFVFGRTRASRRTCPLSRPFVFFGVSLKLWKSKGHVHLHIFSTLTCSSIGRRFSPQPHISQGSNNPDCEISCYGLMKGVSQFLPSSSIKDSRIYHVFVSLEGNKCTEECKEAQTFREVVVISVKNISGLVSIDNDKNWLCIGVDNHTNVLLPDPASSNSCFFIS